MRHEPERPKKRAQNQNWRPGGAKSRLAAFLVLVALRAQAGIAAPAAMGVSGDDLEAITRSLGFLDTLPHDGTIVIEVVYAPALEGSQAIAADAAEKLNAIPGPNSAVIQAQSIAVDALAQDQTRLDALLTVPGACHDSSYAAAVNSAAHQRHVVSISSDPTCLDTKCCVLLVRSDRKVEIVLDTALADAVGAHFSSVFAMMVKRK